MKLSITRRLLTITALLTLTVGLASASQIAVYCGGFSLAGTGPGGYFSPVVNPVATGNITCPVYNTLPAGQVFASEQLILQADYTGGNTGTNTVQTTYSPGTLAMLADTLSVTGVVTSGAYSDTYGVNFPFNVGLGLGGPSFWVDGAYVQSTYPTVGGTIAYSARITSGTVQAVSGNVWELITYNPPQTGTPEPATMAMLGSALIGLGLIGRKRFVG